MDAVTRAVQRGKRGRVMGVYIKGMEMPKNCGECHFCHTEGGGAWCCPTEREDILFDAIPEWCPLSADAVQGYTEWLEKIIVEDGTVEWLCEDTTDEEWCEKNCHHSSIQAECLRHLYEVSKGGDTE